MILTDEIEQELNQLRATGRRLTKYKFLAKKLGITNEDAQSLLNQYRTKHQERVRVTPAGEEMPATEEPKPTKPKRPWWDIAVDSGALAVGVGISMILNVVVFFVISPDWITAIGMVVLAPTVVLFSVRGWILGGWIGKTLWAMFVIVEVFSGISFALASTDLQAKTEGIDTELTRLTAKVEHDQNALDDLQAKYNAIGEGFRGELTVRQSAIADARKALDGSELARREYLASKGKEGKEGVSLTSDKVFSAIPDAVTSGRWIQLAFFTLIFSGLALTVISSASSMIVRRD